MLFAEAVVNAGKDVYHQIIRDKLTLVDESLGCLAKFCFVLDFVAQHIAGRDMSQAIFLDHQIALCTLTRTRGTENNNILHLFF